ncbi:MAG: TRAP transporter large permease [Firmicutes bacterium]|jgi:tripartite ATP-independent transporter DctM subunit|nr:TRAP transporter large permease [Bacillota bacterium]
MGLTVFTISLVALIALGMPIVFSMIVASWAYALASGVALTVVAQKMVTGLESFTLLAVPLFMLSAEAMNNTSVTRRLFDFANKLVGRFPGGIGHVNVFTSMIFAGMSGSAVADTCGIGYVCLTEMDKRGFGMPFSTAVTAASSTIGPIIPPSIPMVVYAVVAGASVGKLFLGGAIPGVLMGVTQMIYIYCISLKRGYAAEKRSTWREKLIATRNAVLPLLTPVILLGGIYGGVFTPTEAAAVAVLYALCLGAVYGDLNLRKLGEISVRVLLSAGIIMSIVAAANLFSWVMAAEQVPQRVGAMFLSVTNTRVGLLFMLNIVFLILGAIMDINTILLVFVPMVLPAVTAMGIDLVHFGVIVVLNTMIGLLTPPYGMNLFILSGLTGLTINQILKELWPFIIMLVGLLFLITYVEPIVMWLPNLLVK